MQLDPYDLRILQELQRDGRQSWVELGEHVSLSASACQRRVQGLRDAGVITGFGVRVDPAALGYEIEAYVAVRVERHDVHRARQFRETMQRYPEVQECRMLSGDVDFLLRVLAADVRSYGRFVEEKILSLPGVKDASTSIVLDRIKTESILPD